MCFVKVLYGGAAGACVGSGAENFWLDSWDAKKIGWAGAVRLPKTAAARRQDTMGCSC